MRIARSKKDVGPPLELEPICIDDPNTRDLAAIATAMLWPNDPAARSLACDAAVSASLEEEISQVPRDILEDLASWRAGVFPLKFVHEKIKNGPFLEGYIAGKAFHDLIALLLIAPQRASWEAAIARVTRPFYPRKDDPRPPHLTRRISSKTFHNEVWPRFRPVAHFWAATVFAYENGESREFPCAGQDLQTYLARSEFFRREGESRRSNLRSGDTILDARETVKIPNSLDVPQIIIDFELSGNL
jgi:hypothetical protein